MRIFGALAVLMLAGCVTPEPAGRTDFETYCAACHGTDARGDGRTAAELWLDAPDLTRIAARRDGNFPYAEVMSVIDGYTRADQHGSRMPMFGPLLEGGTVLVDLGDGTLTPTPERLVALADYLQGIQR